MSRSTYAKATEAASMLKKHRGGRPLKDGAARSKSLGVRVTPEMYGRLENVATSRGITFTDAINLALAGGLRGPAQLPDPFPLDPPEVGEFHWRDGLMFKRLADGSVRIRKADLWLSLTIPPNEWESILRSLGTPVGEASA